MGMLEGIAAEEHIEDAIRKRGDRFEIQRTKGQDSFLVFAKDIKNKQDVFMKFPLRDTSEEECQLAYDVKKMVPDRTHLARLIGTEPIQFGGHYGVLMEQADGSLRDYFQLKKHKNEKITEDKAVEIVTHASLGLQSMHLENIIHRDIKKSNILRHRNIKSEDTWVTSDFGTTTIGEVTDTYNSVEEYTPYEFLDRTVKKKKYSFTSDIFAMATILFECVHPENKTPHKLYEENGKSRYENAMEEIDKLNLKNKNIEHVLRRGLAEKAPEVIPKGKTVEDYRYVDIGEMINDLNGGTIGSGTIDPEKHEDYQTFVKVNEKFEKTLKTVDDHRTDNDYELLDHETIARIAELNKEVIQIGNSENVIKVPGKDSLIEITSTLYKNLCLSEDKKLKNVMGEVIEKFEGEKLMHLGAMIYEKSFLFGPPITYSGDDPKEKANRKKFGGKSRYTLNEIKNKKAHWQNDKRPGREFKVWYSG